MRTECFDPKMRAEGLNSEVMDVDPMKYPAASAAETSTKADDPKYEKPSSTADPAVKQSMRADGIDPKILDVKKQAEHDTAKGPCKLCKHPHFKERTNQLEMHFSSKAAPSVKQKMQAEESDPDIPDVNSTAPQDDTRSGPGKLRKNSRFKKNSYKLETLFASKVDPVFEKKTQAEGTGPEIPDVINTAPQDDTTSGQGKRGKNSRSKNNFNKLETLFASKVGPAVEKKAQAEGSDPEILDHNSPVIADDTGSCQRKLRKGPPVNLVKMLQTRQLGLLREIEMHPEGVGTKICDSDCSEPAPTDDLAGTPLAKHPVYGRYFLMLKSQTPKPAIEAELLKGGHDPAVLSLDPNKPMPSDFLLKKGNIAPAPAKKDDRPKKANPKPRMPMRSLFWSKIEDRDKTVWKKLSDDNVELPDEVLDSLEADFAKQRKEKEKDEKSTAAEKRQEEKKKDVTLVDNKVSQNVGIALHKLKMSKTEIRDAIVAVDEEKLDTAKCELLLKSCPTPEDMAAVTEFAGDVSTLGRVEQFFREIAGIPDIKNRLECMLFKQKLESTVEVLDTRLKTVTLACEHVSRSDRLAKLLEVVLRLGNYINGGTSRGGVWGFKLEALAKLATIKSLDNKKTLMNWLVQWCQDNDPSLIDFYGDFPEISEAARCSLTQWASDFGQLRTKIELLEQHIAARRKQAPQGDRFVEVMTPFHDRAGSATERLRGRFTITEARFGDLVRSFDEDPKTCGVEEFFKKLLGDFVTCFKKAEQQNEKRKAREEKARQREQAAVCRAALKASGENSGKAGSKFENAEDILAKIHGPRQRRQATRARHFAAAVGDPPPTVDSTYSDERLQRYVCRVNGVSIGSRKHHKLATFRQPCRSQLTWKAPAAQDKFGADSPEPPASKPADDAPPQILAAVTIEADNETIVCPPTAHPCLAPNRLNSAESRSEVSMPKDVPPPPANTVSRSPQSSVLFIGTVYNIHGPQSLVRPSSPTHTVSQSSSSPQSSVEGTPRTYGEGELLKLLKSKTKKKQRAAPK